jgi:uncharacterized protein YndB with AHSA1/START domain
MPTTRRKRTIAASQQELWDVVCDPHHLPRWWPRVTRVEDVTVTGTSDADAFTEVLGTRKGRGVRADFRVVESDAPRVRRWAQELEGSPFERMLISAETEVHLRAVDGDRSEVTLVLRQSVQGFFNRFGGFMFRRAAGATLDQALDGLERIVG